MVLRDERYRACLGNISTYGTKTGLSKDPAMVHSSQFNNCFRQMLLEQRYGDYRKTVVA